MFVVYIYIYARAYSKRRGIGNLKREIGNLKREIGNLKREIGNSIAEYSFIGELMATNDELTATKTRNRRLKL
jgi:hypothetical protein